MSLLTFLSTMIPVVLVMLYWLSSFFFFFSSRRRHTRFKCDWSSDVCSSDLVRHSRLRLPRSRGQHGPHPGAALRRPAVAAMCTDAYREALTRDLERRGAAAAGAVAESGPATTPAQEAAVIDGEAGTPPRHRRV